MTETESHPRILEVMIGLPRSGKSTLIASRLAAGEQFAVVSPDAIRLALHGQRYEELAEPFVWAIAKTMVRALFRAGHRRVVIDATNVTRARRKFWHPVKGDDWVMYYTELDTTTDECIARALREKDDEIVPVIRRMAAEYETLNSEGSREGG